MMWNSLKIPPPNPPVILINRTSALHSTISVDDKAVGREAARLLYDKGYREAALLAGKTPYVATGVRTKAFLTSCKELGIEIASEALIYCDNSIEGGVKGAAKYLRLGKRPPVIYSEADELARGALYELHRSGVAVPEDTEILTTSLMSPETTLYTIPSLSVIEISQQEVSREIVAMLMKLLSGEEAGPLHKILQPKVVLRESFSL